MRLRVLDARFVEYVPPVAGRDGGGLRRGGGLADADGIWFLCPKCFPGHGVLCWFAGRVPDDVEPGPARWRPSGTGLDDLTLDPSVQLNGGCGWHGFVRDGGASQY